MGIVQGRGGVVCKQDPFQLGTPSKTAEQLQPNDAACIGDHRRLDVQLGLVIEQAPDRERFVLIGIELRGTLWPLSKVRVRFFVSDVVFTRLTPVHQSAFEAMCGIWISEAFTSFTAGIAAR